MTELKVMSVAAGTRIPMGYVEVTLSDDAQEQTTTVLMPKAAYEAFR
jgi:hypothetical protein